MKERSLPEAFQAWRIRKVNLADGVKLTVRSAGGMEKLVFIQK